MCDATVDKDAHRRELSAIYEKAVCNKEAEIERLRAVLEVEQKRYREATQDFAAANSKRDETFREIQEVFAAKVHEIDGGISTEISAGYDMIAQRLRDEFHAKADADAKRTQAEHTAQLLEIRTTSLLEAERWKAQCEKLQEQLDGVAPYRRELDAMRERLTEKQRQVDVMCRTNAARGNVGEDAISRAVAAAFPSATVSDASKSKQACDIHVAFPDGRLVALESKNKGIVTPGDVEKFVRDIRALKVSKAKFAGGVFVSVASPNIPNKGDLFCEVVDGLPATYVGFPESTGLDAEFLAKVVKMHLQVYDVCVAFGRRSAVASDVVTRVQGLFQHVQKIRGQAEKMRASCAGIIDGIDTMKRDVDALFDGMHEMLAAHVDDVDALVSETTVNCSVCGKVFSCKGIKSHMKQKHHDVLSN
jgi:hypothetical protein